MSVGFRLSQTLKSACLTLKAPIMFAADDSHEKPFQKKIRLEISCESSARLIKKIK